MHLPTLNLAMLLAAPLMAAAAMYSKPVVTLDAKDFKKVMSNEHAAVSHHSHPRLTLDGRLRGPMVRRCTTRRALH